jgi:hypothetical protein
VPSLDAQKGCSALYRFLRKTTSNIGKFILIDSFQRGVQPAQHDELMLIPSSISRHNLSWRIAIFASFLFFLNQTQCRIFSLKGRVKVKSSSSSQAITRAIVGALIDEVVGALVGASVIPIGFPVGDAEGVILAVELLVGVTPDSLLGVLVGVLEGMPLGSTEG